MNETTQNINESKDEVVVSTKRKTPKANLWATVVMIVLGLLAVVIIVMAIVPKSYAIELPETQPVHLVIYQNSSNAPTTVYRDVDKDLYDDMWKAFNDSFSQSSLSALFQDELTNNITYRYVGNNLSLSTIAQNNDYVLGLEYSDTQTLYRDGEPCVCDELKTNSNYTDGVVTFKKLWVTVNSASGVNEVNFYVQRMVSANSTSSNYAVYQITTKGLQSNLVETIVDAIEAKE